MRQPSDHGHVLNDLIRGVVLLSVVVGTITLGLYDALDSAAVTGVLGAVVGAVGAAAASAVSGSRNDE